MRIRVLIGDKCTPCGQVYSMWTSAPYGDKCTLWGQVYSVQTGVPYVHKTGVPYVHKYILRNKTVLSRLSKSDVY